MSTIVLAGSEAERLGVEAVHLGAQDYLVKGQLDGSHFARSVRYAIKRARTLRAMRESEKLARMYAERLVVLHDLSRQISSTLDPERVLGSIVRGAVELLNADRSRLFLLSPDGKNLQPRASFGSIPDPPGGPPVLPVGGPPSGVVAQEGKPVIIEDIQREVTWGEPGWARTEGLHAYIAVPLVVRGEVAGVLNCVSKTPNRFQQSDVNLMEALAANAVIALENARVFEELRDAQAQLLRSEKLASMGTLVAGVAHEILNPLNNLSIQVQMLKEGILADDPEALGESYRTMDTQVNRITRITQNFLHFARHREPQLKNLDMRNVLDQVLDLVEYQYRVENVELVRDYARDLPQVEGDEDQLGQVFLNFLANARDAMPEGGQITLRTRSCLRDGTPWVRITVEDTGTGMPKGILNQIFDPFFTTKPEGKGTGLGLSVSYGIVENHGGKLDVETEEGKGTTFLVELPAIRG